MISARCLLRFVLKLVKRLAKIKDLLKTQASSLRGGLLTRVDDKMATFVHTHSSFCYLY